MAVHNITSYTSYFVADHATDKKTTTGTKTCMQTRHMGEDLG